MKTPSFKSFLIKGILIIVTLWIAIGLGIYTLVESQGGVKNIIIETGKEIKEISKEIEDYEPQ